MENTTQQQRDLSRRATGQAATSPRRAFHANPIRHRLAALRHYLDDDELMNELDELEAKEYEMGMLDLEAPGKSTNYNNVVNNVPAQQVPVKKNDDLDDLYNELQL